MPGWLVDAIGVLGLIGLGGFIPLKKPVDPDRSGQWIRHMGILGLGGLAGFWLPGVGALGAAGSLGMWNHQSPRLRVWGALGWCWIIGAVFLALWAFGRGPAG
jgi:hypothetical protein